MFLFGVCVDPGFSFPVTSTASLYVCEEAHICTVLCMEIFMCVCSIGQRPALGVIPRVLSTLFSELLLKYS